MITNFPRAFDLNLGKDIPKLFRETPIETQNLLVAVAGCSPYLKSLIEKERDWLKFALDHPHECLNKEFESLTNSPGNNIAKALRCSKRRVALWVALCDLGGIFELQDVTRVLTQYAELAVSLALSSALRIQINRAKLPGISSEVDPNSLGMFVLGMGKMGACELNYSSDIDLICLFDESRFEQKDFYQARRAFIVATKDMSSMLNDLTEDGYVFRTDLRLRPDPVVTPVCVGMDAAERYYESRGRTWERAAFIKARVVAGDLKAGTLFLSRMLPFVWRKHLDFAAIEDAHNMRLAIRDHKGLGGAISLPGHDIKLGRGGIREIEFYTQTRQLISGGRDKTLRSRQTVESLLQLANQGWVPVKTAVAMSEHYKVHRKIEHRLQMINDAQTHNLPKSPEGFRRLAAMMGLEENILKADIHRRLSVVHELSEGFFAGPTLASFIPEELNEFKSVTDIWSNYPALRSERALKNFERLQPEILKRLRSAAKPQEAVLAFDGFLSGLPAGVQLFALFEAYPKLIDLLIDIVTISPALAQYLARNAQVFDAVIAGAFWGTWPEAKGLIGELQTMFNASTDYEEKLNLARRWGKEWHFRIGVHLLRGLISAEEAGSQYADLAEAMIAGLFPEVIAEFSVKYGNPPGRGAVVLGMGSLGARRLHSASDLDLIIIYDADGVEISKGPRPLQARLYYARLAQALVTAITAPMTQGRLYEVDMRLRPSGNQGPVATSWQAFTSYQQTEAWIWEHLAMCRARVVAGNVALGKDVEVFCMSLMGRNDIDAVKIALARMRLRLALKKGPGEVWDIKDGAGRLQDIELISQLGRLLSGGTEPDVMSGLMACVGSGVLNDAERTEVEAAYRLLWSLRIALNLLGQTNLDSSHLASGATRFLNILTGYTTLEVLKDDLVRKSEKVADILNRVLPKVQDDDYEG